MLQKFHQLPDVHKLLIIFGMTLTTGLMGVVCVVLVLRALPSAPKKSKASASVKPVDVDQDVPDVQDFNVSSPVPAVDTFSHEIKLLATNAKFRDWPAIARDNQKAIVAYMAAERYPNDSPDAHLLRKRYYFLMAWKIVEAGKVDYEKIADSCDWWDEHVNEYFASEYVNPRGRLDRGT